MKMYKIASNKEVTERKQPSREKGSHRQCEFGIYVSDFTTSGSVSGSLLEGGGVPDAVIPKSCGVKAVTSKEDVPDT